MTKLLRGWLGLAFSLACGLACAAAGAAPDDRWGGPRAASPQPAFAGSPGIAARGATVTSVVVR